MILDRLYGITIYLLNHERASASTLAKEFGRYKEMLIDYVLLVFRLLHILVLMAVMKLTLVTS